MTTSQIVVVMVSVIIGAVLKSTSGIGMPFVTIPAISYIATIEEAVVVGALPNLALNLALVWAQRSHWSQHSRPCSPQRVRVRRRRSWHVPAGVTSREAADSGAHLGGARVRGAQAGLARIRGRPRNVTPVGASRWVSCRNHAGRRGHLWTDRGVVGPEPSARPKRADPGGHGAIRRSGHLPISGARSKRRAQRFVDRHARGMHPCAGDRPPRQPDPRPAQLSGVRPVRVGLARLLSNRSGVANLRLTNCWPL